MKKLISIFALAACSVAALGQTPQYLPKTGGAMTGPLVAPAINGAINAGSYATFDLALAACPGSGQCVIAFPAGTWASSLSCISRSNLALIGSGVPNFDSYSAPTKLVGGTIIQPGLSFCGASNVTVMNMGFDDGPAYVGSGGTATNGLIFEGATGSNPADPTVQNINVMNVVNLGSSATAAFHGVIVEHANSVFLSNVDSVFDTHCYAIKSSNVIALGVVGRGCFSNVFIVKTDAYTPNQSNITIAGLQGSSVAAGDTTNGVNIDAEAGTISNVIISNVTMNGVRDPVFMNNLVANGAITGVKISNAIFNISNLASGSAACVTSTGGGGSNAQIGLVGFDCINSTGLAVAPLQVFAGWTNSSITDWKSVNAGFSSTLVGTFNIDNWADLGTSAPSMPTFTATTGGTVIGVSNWTSTRGNAESSVSGGAVIGGAAAGTFTTVGATQGLFASGATVSVSSLSSPTLMTTGAYNGLLHIRDNTLGGSAVFIVDPNGGVQLVGSSSITGLTSAAGITFSSGWKVALSSGSVPRTLQWAFFQ